jgi:hypothetical protein
VLYNNRIPSATLERVRIILRVYTPRTVEVPHAAITLVKMYSKYISVLVGLTAVVSGSELPPE